VSGGSSQSVTLQQPGGGVTNNRIANVNGGSSYTYDATGNTTFDAAHSFLYDAESRIVKVDSGNTATYFYDSANRRVKKVVGTGASATTTYYVWEGSSVIAEYGNAPAGSGGTRFYHPDRLSTRMISDGSGVVKGTMDNLPFGEDAGVLGVSEKHRFAGYERDVETNSDYAINRQHQFSTGRFTRSDPVGGTIADPQSLNRYPYAQDDPINLSDPLGLFVYYCPPQYSSCATLAVSINGVLFYVNVGFRSGHGTFLWDQLGFSDQEDIARLMKESPLPEGFDIFPSFSILLREGSIERKAGNTLARRIQKELSNCDQVGRQASDDYLKDPSHPLDLQLVMNRPRNAQGILNGIQIATAAGVAMKAARAGASITPPGAILNAMSMFGVIPSLSDLGPTWQDLLSQVERQTLNGAADAGRRATKKCKKGVRRKYGV
jgi:RHS repeat-associated protein